VSETNVMTNPHFKHGSVNIVICGTRDQTIRRCTGMGAFFRALLCSLVRRTSLARNKTGIKSPHNNLVAHPSV
jgi:hypothetical protein